MVYDGIYSLLNDAIDSLSTLYWNLAVIFELWHLHIRYCMPQDTVTLHWMGSFPRRAARPRAYSASQVDLILNSYYIAI